MENIKTNIHNLIILDESGSMSSLTQSTIDGCNSVIESIRKSQKENLDTQTHYLSIYLFQSDSTVPSRYIIKDRPIGEVGLVTKENYQPWGCTPLYDAIGATLCDLHATTAKEKLALGSVTIITDGMENSSQHYTYGEVVKMINALKEEGWNFNFIGANIDAMKTAARFGIDNAMQWEATRAGTARMFDTLNESRDKWSQIKAKEIHELRNMAREAPMASEDIELEYRKRSKASSKGFFKK